MNIALKINGMSLYILEGDFIIIDINDNDTTPKGSLARICRYGKSETKPFCDGYAHAKTIATNIKL